MDPLATTYLPRRRLFVGAGVFYLILAAGVFGWGAADGWRPGSFSALLAACSGLYACCALYAAMAAIMRRPRLLVTGRDIRLRGIFRSVAIDRGDLGLFELVPSGLIYLRRAPVAALARVRRSGAGGARWKRNSFQVPDIFETPIWRIQQELNRSHPDPNLRRTFSPSAVFSAIIPWASLGLTALVLIVFVIQTSLLSPLPDQFQGPSGWALWAAGGLYFRSVYQDGEWYRLLAGPFLHGNVQHVILNSVGLLLAGPILERMIGHARLMAAFLVGLLVSAHASMVFDTPVTVSVGVSGGIMTMFAVILVASLRGPPNPAKHSQRRLSFLILVLSLTPLDYVGPGLRVDIAAHLGGALAGFGLSPVLLRRSMSPSVPEGAERRYAIVALVGSIAIVASLGMAAVRFPGHLALIENVMPQDQVPVADNDWPARGADLLKRYPGDPRSHFAYAQTLVRSGRFAAAEQELRTARELMPATEILIGPDFERSITLSLSFVLARQGKRDAALEEARPLCDSATRRALDQRTARFLASQHLCP